MMNGLRQTIDKYIGGLLVIIMATMVINVLWQVFSRYILNAPSAFTDELARYLMIWLGLLGAAYVSGRKMHVAIDVLPSMWKESMQKKVSIFVNFMIILFAVLVMVIGGVRLVYITLILSQHSPSLNIPLSIVYSIVPISGIVIILYKLIDIKKDWQWN